MMNSRLARRAILGLAESTMKRQPLQREEKIIIGICLFTAVTIFIIVGKFL